MNATFATLVLSVTIVSAAIVQSEIDIVKHMKTNMKFKCNNPQPRSVIVHEDQNPNLSFMPSMTVLHRCQRSGCCTNGICSPATEEDVKIVFKKTVYSRPIEDDDSLFLNETFITEILKNHTSCHCL